MIRGYISRFPIASFILCALGFFFVGFFAYRQGFSISQQNVVSLRLHDKAYSFIDPLLLCNLTGNNNPNNDVYLEGLINRFINDRVAKGVLSDMSIYLASYGNGKRVAINENEKYDPASMLKVPIMMAYYDASIKNPKILSETIAFTGETQNTNEYFKGKEEVHPNKVYSVDDLVHSMIVNSDNTATVLLKNYIGNKTLYDVYTDLSLPIPNVSSSVEYLSAKSYAYFFRVLYNATYLGREYSEKALELLSHTAISGIRAGVPEGVVVADKFGERTVSDNKSNVEYRELHDCGIVYKKDSPYLLCVMSRGQNLDALMNNIKDLSTLVYENISVEK